MSICGSKYCSLNMPGAMISQNLKLVFCPLCKDVSYCSQKCRDLDWQSRYSLTIRAVSHKLLCRPDTSPKIDTSDVNTLKLMRRNPDEFEIVHQGGNLGKGSYGSVKLVKDKKNGLLYAMKIMVKRDIFEYCSVDNLKREIRIQKKLDHPHVTKLFHYFEDKENVYLILEYAKNGSLFNHLRRCKYFPENEAFVYFFQTCLGIDYLHKKCIIHRDLKPENLLLDEGGNIKICDFGWSAESKGGTQKRTTFCGTTDYMAPEMIENKPHDATLDLWCLGILLYELFHGEAPFKGRNDIEKCNNIVKKSPIEFRQDVSYDAKDLILSLLKYSPSERLPMANIFRHPFMKRIAITYEIDIQQYVYQESTWKQNLSKSNDCSPEIKGLKQSKTQVLLADREPSLVSTNYNTHTKGSQDQYNQAQYSNLSTSLFNSVSYEDRNQRISKNTTRNRQEIQQPPQRKESGILDKFLIQLGCMKRD